MISARRASGGASRCGSRGGHRPGRAGAVDELPVFSLLPSFSFLPPYPRRVPPVAACAGGWLVVNPSEGCTCFIFHNEPVHDPPAGHRPLCFRRCRCANACRTRRHALCVRPVLCARRVVDAQPVSQLVSLPCRSWTPGSAPAIIALRQRGWALRPPSRTRPPGVIRIAWKHGRERCSRPRVRIV